MRLSILEIRVAGQPVPQDRMHEYSFLISSPGGTPKPVLYHKGKRVTDEYIIQIDHVEPKDPHGRSA